MMRRMADGSPQKLSLRVSSTRLFDCHCWSEKAADPAEFCESQAAPQSPSRSFSWTSMESMIEPGPTMPSVAMISCGLTFCGRVTTTVRSSRAVNACSAPSAVNPYVFRKLACARLSVRRRRNDQTTSSARTGFPDANCAPSRSVKVMVVASSETSQLSARSGCTSDRFSGSS